MIRWFSYPAGANVEVGSPATRRSSSSQTGIRYRSMLVNATLVAISLTLIWTWPGLLGSTRVITTAVVIGTSVVWFFIWLVFRSRIPGWPKRITLAAIGTLLLLAVVLLRVRAYTGNLVPILGWRWSSHWSASHVTRGDQPGIRKSFDVQTTQYDYPGFLGRNRRGEVENVRLFRDWSARPPKLLWRKVIGDDAGFSSFAVVGHVGLTQQQAGDQELVVCYDLPTGNVLWTHADPVRFASTIGGIGPRGTPTVDQGKVYTLGATGVLNCLDFQSGRRLWSHHVLEDHDAVILRWGIAASPLIVDDLLVVKTGHPKPDASSFSTLVAYHKDSGQLVWQAGQDGASYSSPTIVTLDGKRQILTINATSVAAHDPATGKVLWQRPWPAASSNTSQPVAVSPNQLLLSKGYGIGARLWQIETTAEGDWSVSELWHEPKLLKTKFTTAVVRDGYAYGLSDGLLECVDIAKGARRWKARGYGHGQVILVDDLLLVQAESGDVALVEAEPAGHREVARFSPLSSRTWNYPTLAGSYLLVRNDREIACYQLPLNTPPRGQGD